MAASVKLVRDYFGMKLKEMKEEWTSGLLTETDKAQILDGLSSGSLDYNPTDEQLEAARSKVIKVPSGDLVF